MKLRVSMPFRMLTSNATEAARAAAAAYEAADVQLPPLPSQFGGAVGFAWLLLCVAAAAVVLLLLLRAYLDNGGLIPLSGRCVVGPATAGEAGCPAAAPLCGPRAARRADTHAGVPGGAHAAREAACARVPAAWNLASTLGLASLPA